MCLSVCVSVSPPLSISLSLSLSLSFSLPLHVSISLSVSVSSLSLPLSVCLSNLFVCLPLFFPHTPALRLPSPLLFFLLCGCRFLHCKYLYQCRHTLLNFCNKPFDFTTSNNLNSSRYVAELPQGTLYGSTLCNRLQRTNSTFCVISSDVPSGECGSVRWGIALKLT